VKHLGVDGCRAGWLVVSHVGGEYRAELVQNFSELMQRHGDASRIFIDIPIGLPHSGMPKRPCDALARKLLGPRASSVFSPPCREAAYATDYIQAKALNAAELGVRFSIQAWGICKKIAEVDAYLRHHPGHQAHVHEAHPELAFWQLNQQQHLSANKKTDEGAAQRMLLLTRAIPGADTWVHVQMRQSRRTQYLRDDLLDAMALCLRAQAYDATGTPPCALGDTRDAHGLPMTICY